MEIKLFVYFPKLIENYLSKQDSLSKIQFYFKDEYLLNFKDEYLLNGQEKK